jgi:hypothetical protein
MEKSFISHLYQWSAVMYEYTQTSASMFKCKEIHKTQETKSYSLQTSSNFLTINHLNFPENFGAEETTNTKIAP